MKDQLPVNLRKFRVDLPGYVREPDESIQGFFLIPYENFALRVMCSVGEGWDHVSVSVKGRCPTWMEMNWIRKLFFLPEETVVQFHPPEAEYVNLHPHTLHMWRSHSQKYELPPKWMIAPIVDQIPRLNIMKRSF